MISEKGLSLTWTAPSPGSEVVATLSSCCILNHAENTMSSEEWRPPTGPRKALRQVKVCPDPDCFSLERPPLASWKGLNLFENGNSCAVCRCRFIVLEEVDSLTYEDCTRNKIEKPRRMRLCTSCPPFRNTAVYSWKGKYTKDFQPEREKERFRCIVDGCGLRLVEFWEIGYAISTSRRPSLVSRRSSSFQDRADDEQQWSPRNNSQSTKRVSDGLTDLERPLKRTRSNDDHRKVHFETENPTHSPAELRSQGTDSNIQRELKSAASIDEAPIHSQSENSAKTTNPEALPRTTSFITQQGHTSQAPAMPQQASTRDVEQDNFPTPESIPNPKSNINDPRPSTTKRDKLVNPSAHPASPHPDLYYDDFGLLRFTPEVMQDVLAKLKESATQLATRKPEETRLGEGVMLKRTETVEQARAAENTAMEDLQAA